MLVFTIVSYKLYRLPSKIKRNQRLQTTKFVDQSQDKNHAQTSETRERYTSTTNLADNYIYSADIEVCDILLNSSQQSDKMAEKDSLFEERVQLNKITPVKGVLRVFR